MPYGPQHLPGAQLRRPGPEDPFRQFQGISFPVHRSRQLRSPDTFLPRPVQTGSVLIKAFILHEILIIYTLFVVWKVESAPVLAHGFYLTLGDAMVQYYISDLYFGIYHKPYK